MAHPNPGLGDINSSNPENIEMLEAATLDPGVQEPQDVKPTSGDDGHTEGQAAPSRSQQQKLRLILGLAAITSPLTATIYLPLLPLLRRQFHSSAQAINLTLTLYIVFQAISPVLFGPFSDSLGRRPIFLLTLTIYSMGNLGLALNKHNYAVLLVLRALQSLGASAAYAISFGVVADVCAPSERGRMLGPIGMALNLGACLGPVIGGTVAYTNGNHIWVFWSLTIVGVALLLSIGFLLPETASSVVADSHNGQTYSWRQLSWLQILRHHRHKTGQDNAASINPHPASNSTALPSPAPVTGQQPHSPYSQALRNLLSCFRLIFHRDTFLTVWIHGSFYTVDYSFVAALPDIFETTYDFNSLQIGLAYLPRGVGIILGSFLTGKLMDYNYKRVLKKMRLVSTNLAHQIDLYSFPIEQARSSGSLKMLVLSTAVMVGYGWAIQKSAHPAILLILQFSQGAWGTYFYTTYSTLLVDVFPEKPSTAAAATSVTRCTMAAAGIAMLEPLLKATGYGWYFTMLGFWSGSFGAVAIILLRRRGQVWRQHRTDKRTDQGVHDG